MYIHIFYAYTYIFFCGIQVMGALQAGMRCVEAILASEGAHISMKQLFIILFTE